MQDPVATVGRVILDAAPLSIAAPPSIAAPLSISAPLALAPMRNGRSDPTTRLGPGEFRRATFTPTGPATIRLRWHGEQLDAQAWGPGADHLLARADEMVGRRDEPFTFVDAHPAVMHAQHHHPHLRLGASRSLYHDLLPTIIAQRITGGEAIAQWRRLCWKLGAPAPGPFKDLRLPPDPDRLARAPSWWFHPLGIERSRAETLVTVARHATRLHEWAMLPPAELARCLHLLRGVGEWTIGTVLASSSGEPDAVAVGDYHLKNIVSYALAGEPRGTDERMLELLEPYRGQRGRVVRLLTLDGHRAPAFGPRQRILPMASW